MTGWRTFLIIWFGQLVSLLGSALTSFALGVWIFERTGSATQFALAFLCLVLPRVLFGPFAGALVDRWDRRAAMTVGDAGAALSTLSIALLVAIGQLQVWHIYVGKAVASAFGAIQRPAYAVAVAAMIPSDRLVRANGLRRIASSTADLLAPILAGFLVVAIGVERVILLDVASFAVALLTLAVVRFPATPRAGPREAEPSLWHEAVEGWRYIALRPGLRGLLRLYAATSALGVTAEVLLTPYVLATNSATGAGLLLGGLILAAWGGPRRRVAAILGFEFVVSLCTIALGLRLPALGIALVMLVYFAAIALGDGNSEALWQSKVPPGLQGRAFATRDMVALAALPLGVLLATPLAEFVLTPALDAGGTLATSVGAIIGAGPGRGIGLIFILTGVINVVIVVIAALHPRMARVDLEIPDAVRADTVQAAPSRSGADLVH